MQYIAKSNLDNKSPKRRASFARSMMLEQFGWLGHLHDDDWRDHNDISAEHLAQKRKQVLLSGVAS
jgi:hypothetical protein